MSPGTTLRVARPTDRLDAISRQYQDGLELQVLAAFSGHGEFDGVILGHPQQAWHLEFTTHHGSTAGRAPTPDNLLVFYLDDPATWQAQCRQMVKAGFREVPSFNPYWDRQGRTFEDLDGYRVVLQQALWPL